MKVLLDTNFMMLPNQFGVDIFEYLKYDDAFTLSSCVGELKKLGRERTRDGLAARIALQLIEKNRVKVVETEEEGDAAVMDYAINNKCAVGTNDANLIKALKDKGIKIIRLRQKKYLTQEG